MSDFRWSNASRPIWSIVSGLPSGPRERRLLLMLQVFIDDSVEPPVFVQAGCIATAEKWAAFSDAWRAVLDGPPRLDYFKMKEAWRLQDQFRGWTEEQRDRRLIELYEVYQEYVCGECLVSFSIDGLKQAYAMWPKEFSHPYYFAVPLLMAELGRNIEALKQGRQPLEFIYDTQLSEKDKIVAAWEWGTARSNPDPPDLLTLLRGPPMFRNDKEVLPLQAADLIAWWVRRRFVAQSRGEVPLVPPFKQTKKIPWFATQMSTEQLIAFARNAGTLKGGLTAKYGYGFEEGD
jgi:hypothetical protein